MSVPQKLLDEIALLKQELAHVQQLKNNCVIEHYDSKGRLIFITHNTNDGLWDWNLVNNDVYYSPSWKEILGYEAHELKNNFDTWSNNVHVDDKKLVIQTIENNLSNNIDTFEIDMRMLHREGYYLYIRSRILQVYRDSNNKPIRIIGAHVDVTQRKQAELFEQRHSDILKMIAQGDSASKIYNEIASLYEGRHIGIRCSMLELEGDTLIHGSAPSLPQEYCDSVHGLTNGPEVGSCGASTYTGKRVVVENIETDPKWKNIKHVALPYGMRSCWSEPIISSTGEVLGAFGMYRDYPAVPNEKESNDLTAAAQLTSIVMERDRNLKRIQSLAYTDELTSLSSRAHLFLNVEHLIKSSERYKDRFSLLYIDLDNFKNVNDSLGHDIGDYLLKEVGARIADLSREADCVARIGGDEFCIVTKELNNSYSAAIIAQRIIDVVATPIELSGRKFIPACSIGIARYPEDGTDLKSLLKAADTALYSAKDTGKSCYAFYNIELSRIAEYHFKVEQLLREAIEQNQLSLVYQPQIDIETGILVGVEALSRWYHPEIGEIAPVEFIAMAERIGMIKPLTEWVFYQGCKQAVAWRGAGFPELRMAINISPNHLFDHDFIPSLKYAIESTGMNSQFLELEITESVVQTSDYDPSIFKSLKDLGVLLAIDDFGTGYSSFASLKHLAVDYLKIDKYFINDMLKDEKTKLLIRSMLEMGHNLGYKIIAEGVETKEQFIKLRVFGCDIAQGFLFSKPVNAKHIEKLLKKSMSLKRV
ncbi:EAL domain-containing protein [Colwellia sp. RE-S-Sl-9]